MYIVYIITHKPISPQVMNVYCKSRKEYNVQYNTAIFIDTLYSKVYNYLIHKVFWRAFFCIGLYKLL